MNKYAFIFPGQGTQKSGMGKDLYENFESAKRVFDTADDVLGCGISELCFNGSDEDLMKTVNSQPAILTVSIAAYETFREMSEIIPSAVAGHSLGEYAALYAAGIVDLKTVLLLIKKRAEVMNEAALKSQGAMAAVLGLGSEIVMKLAEDMNEVYVANFNSPEQVVITGNKQEIEKNIEKFKSAGAKRVILLAVSGAFHSPFMNSAGIEFKSYVNNFAFNNSNIPVYTNVDAKPSFNGDEIKAKLSKQISSSVMWTQTIENMKSRGINKFIEIGTGKVLAGLNKKISPELKTYNIYDKESLDFVINELENSKEKEFV